MHESIGYDTFLKRKTEFSIVVFYFEIVSRTELTFFCPFSCVSTVVRNRVKYAQFRQKRMNTNPGRGPFHFKSPARMVWRTIRGMVNQKTSRGQDALARLSTFEGIPHPYDKKKRVVVPAALRVMRLKTIRDYTVLGELAASVGWKHKDLLKKLEDKRKVKAESFFQKKKAKEELKKKAIAAAESDLAKVNEVLAASGY
jgi:large subunit ribosomal protein L13Ae